MIKKLEQYDIEELRQIPIGREMDMLIGLTVYNESYETTIHNWNVCSIINGTKVFMCKHCGIISSDVTMDIPCIITPKKYSKDYAEAIRLIVKLRKDYNININVEYSERGKAYFKLVSSKISKDSTLGITLFNHLYEIEGKLLPLLVCKIALCSIKMLEEEEPDIIEM